MSKLVANQYECCADFQPPCKFDCPCWYEAQQAIDDIDKRKKL